MKISKRNLMMGSLFGLILFFGYMYFSSSGKLKVVFCNVGQGDAIYIRTPEGQDVLIDGGPNDRVLTCLGNNMPFYDRKIELIFLSHPENDHIKGLISVVNRYRVDYLVFSAVGKDSKVFKDFLKLIVKNNILVKHLFSGDEVLLGGVKFAVLWPEKDWFAENTRRSEKRLSLSEADVLGVVDTARNVNDFSQVMHLKMDEFDILFTGDADSRVQNDIMKRVEIPHVDILKYPHHGSKYGATDKFLKRAHPSMAVISVGKNPWGHPTEETIQLLKDNSIRILRTDLDGEVRIITDGNSWKILD